MSTEPSAESPTTTSELKRLGEPHTGDQRGCARCGADEHLALTYLPFTYPIDMGDGFTATHYAPCPTNGEPILLCQGPKPTADGGSHTFESRA